MYQFVLLALAVVSSVLRYKVKDSHKYRLEALALISGGAAAMFLVDSVFSYLEGEVFIELSWNAATLSAVLVALVIALWVVALVSARIFKHK